MCRTEARECQNAMERWQERGQIRVSTRGSRHRTDADSLAIVPTLKAIPDVASKLRPGRHIAVSLYRVVSGNATSKTILQRLETLSNLKLPFYHSAGSE